MNWRRYKDKKQQLESQAKRIRSLVIETLAIPNTTRRRLLPSSKGPNYYKLPCPLVRFNPFKLTRCDGSTTKSFHEDICRDKTTTPPECANKSR